MRFQKIEFMSIGRRRVISGTDIMRCTAVECTAGCRTVLEQALLVVRDEKPNYGIFGIFFPMLEITFKSLTLLGMNPR